MNGEKPRWKRYFPGIAALGDYERGWLRGDALAGLTVSAYLVPQVMAYAVIAGLPPVVGLWTMLLPVLIYFVLGTSRKLSVGPESTTSLMTAAGVGALVGAAGGPDHYAEVAALMAIAVGVVSLVAAVARLGFLTSLLSRPVLIGYLVGIAVLMIVSQLDSIAKVEVSGDPTWAQIASFATGLGGAHLLTVAVSLTTLILLYLAKWLVPRWPAPLLVLLAAAAVVAVFDLESRGIEVIGQVPHGLPEFRIPRLGDIEIWSLLPYALGIAIVGFSDVILTGRAFDSGSREEKIDANQELVAVGTANVAAGLFHGFPVSCSGSRTVLADAAGAKTQAYSLVLLAAVVMVLIFAGPVLESFPVAGMGALVIYAATQLIDVAEIRRIASFRRSELLITFVTAFSVVAFDVLIGIGIAVGFSIVDLLRRITRPHAAVLGYAPGVPGMHDMGDYPESNSVDGLVVFRYDSPLFFANADDFVERALESVDTHDADDTDDEKTDVRWFLLNAEANTEFDLTAVDALEDLRAQLEERGVRFTMARVKQETIRQLEPSGFIDRVGEDYIYETLPTAVRAYVADYARTHDGRTPDGVPGEILKG